jgi:digeranylgeranylglycerophospholipid reductase
VILASGFRSQLSQKLGLGQIKHFFVGAQAEIEIKNLDEVEIYFGQQIAPGFFAWLVPISPDKCLAGLLSKSQAKLYLQRFLTGPFCRGRIVTQEAKIRQKAVPLGILPRTYGNRILAIGDTAGQVKPTTGGGIFFGHLGARIAAEVLHEALDSDKLGAVRLSGYQRRWKAKMGKEISLGYRARQIYARLGDDRIEQVFDMLNSGGIARALLNSPDFSFDWHRKLILAGLQHGLTRLLPRIGHTLYREARL